MKRIVIATAFSLVLSAALAATPGDEDEPRTVRAIAEIRGCTDSSITGSAGLIERPSKEGIKQIDIRLRMRGMPDGAHAVHIHEVGQCVPCSAAGGHFDPGPAGNSSPDGNHPFHSGDLVNIDIKNGRGNLRTTTNRVTLSPGPLSVFDKDGSAFIIHVNPDTYCPGGEVAGCAGGARLACGVIQPATNHSYEWFE